MWEFLGMKKFLLFLLAFKLFYSPWLALGQEVLVYEVSFSHMETAGGWVAAEKGFYGKVKVEEVQGEPGISPIQKVITALKAGNIAFGNDYPENIIRVREKEGIDLVAVSVDFQASAMRIISWKPIKSAKDIKGDFGIWIGYDAKAKCVVGKGWEKQFTIQNQGGDIKPWLARNWPLASAMVYNELITAQREVRKMGKTFYTIDYKDLGIDWMDNVLFTTEEVIKKYPDIVQTLVAGRYRGFQWAFGNPKETFEILKRANEGLDPFVGAQAPDLTMGKEAPLRVNPEPLGLSSGRRQAPAFELGSRRVDFVREIDAIGPLKALMITPDTKKQGLGYINPKKWENVAKDMFRAGLLDKMPDVKKVYTEKFPSGILPK
jgi:NitT/TauT family transport system substrate-binding protein